MTASQPSQIVRTTRFTTPVGLPRPGPRKRRRRLHHLLPIFVAQDLLCNIRPMTDPASVQVVTDSRVLAAMSHPLRRRLLDALAVDGPSTITTLAERTGQASGNVSHHV